MYLMVILYHHTYRENGYIVDQYLTQLVTAVTFLYQKTYEKVHNDQGYLETFCENLKSLIPVVFVL